MQANNAGMELAGGGFLVGGGGTLNIIDSNVTHVLGAQIGGIFALAGGSLDILRCYFETASAGFMGALIAGSGSTTVVTMRDSVARDMGKHNPGWSWNDITLFDGPTATVTNCRFEACEKGIFYLAQVPPPLRPHTSTNQCLYCLSTGSATLSRAPSSLPKASATVVNCHFEGIDQDRGAIASITQGGVLILTSSTIISRTTFYSNWGSESGAGSRSLFHFDDAFEAS